MSVAVATNDHTNNGTSVPFEDGNSGNLDSLENFLHILPYFLAMNVDHSLRLPVTLDVEDYIGDHSKTIEAFRNATRPHIHYSYSLAIMLNWYSYISSILMYVQYEHEHEKLQNMDIYEYGQLLQLNDENIRRSKEHQQQAILFGEPYYTVHLTFLNTKATFLSLCNLFHITPLAYEAHRPRNNRVALSSAFYANTDLYTDIWGPRTWTFFHTLSVLIAPDNIYHVPEKYSRRFAYLMLNFDVLIFCSYCNEHYRQNDPFNNIVLPTVATGNIVPYLYNFHNIVNASLQKPLFTIEQFQRQYNYTISTKYFQ